MADLYVVRPGSPFDGEPALHPTVEAAFGFLDRAIVDVLAKLLREGDAAFVVGMTIMAATDALSGWRYLPAEHTPKPPPAQKGSDGRKEHKPKLRESASARFKSFVLAYYPPTYHPHVNRLHKFRNHTLHNFSPAHFSLTHCSPPSHLEISPLGKGDRYLCAHTLFGDFCQVAYLFERDVRTSPERQEAMLARLENLSAGGAIFAL